MKVVSSCILAAFDVSESLALLQARTEENEPCLVVRPVAVVYLIQVCLQEMIIISAKKFCSLIILLQIETNI